MEVIKSHVCGAVNKYEAFKCALLEQFKDESLYLHELGKVSVHPGCDMKFILSDDVVCYVYPIGDGYYRIDFTMNVEINFNGESK